MLLKPTLLAFCNKGLAGSFTLHSLAFSPMCFFFFFKFFIFGSVGS